MYGLLQKEAERLNTRTNPLSIPVTKFTVDKKSSMGFITLIREYLTYLNFSVVDLKDAIPPSIDVHHILPETKAQRLRLRRNDGSPCVSVDDFLRNEWYLDPAAHSLRTRPKTAQMLLGTPMQVPTSSWSRTPLRLTRVGKVSNPISNTDPKWPRIWCYNYRISVNQKVELLLGELMEVREDGALILIPLKFHTKLDGNVNDVVYTYDQSPTSDFACVRKDDAISCGCAFKQNPCFRFPPNSGTETGRSFF